MANDEYRYNRLLVWLMRLFSLALFQSAWPPCRKCLRSSFAWIRETPHAGLQRAPVAGTKPPLLLVEWTWRSWDALGHPARIRTALTTTRCTITGVMSTRNFRRSTSPRLTASLEKKSWTFLKANDRFCTLPRIAICMEATATNFIVIFHMLG